MNITKIPDWLIPTLIIIAVAVGVIIELFLSKIVYFP